MVGYVIGAFIAGLILGNLIGFFLFGLVAINPRTERDDQEQAEYLAQWQKEHQR